MESVQQHMKVLRESLSDVKGSLKSAQATAKVMEDIVEDVTQELLDVEITVDSELWMELDKKAMSCTVAFMDAMYEIERRKTMVELIETRIERLQSICERSASEN